MLCLSAGFSWLFSSWAQSCLSFFKLQLVPPSWSLKKGWTALHLVVTWFLLIQPDPEWTCWLTADALVWKHKHRIENDLDTVAGAALETGCTLPKKGTPRAAAVVSINGRPRAATGATGSWYWAEAEEETHLARISRNCPILFHFPSLPSWIADQCTNFILSKGRNLKFEKVQFAANKVFTANTVLKVTCAMFIMFHIHTDLRMVAKSSEWLAADLDSCRGRRHCCRQASRAVAVPTAAARHCDDAITVSVGSRRSSSCCWVEKMRPPPSPQPQLPLSLPLSAPPHWQLFIAHVLEQYILVWMCGLAAAAGGSYHDALPRGRPWREAARRLQLAEAPSLAMWCLRHQQEVCSTAGPAMEGGDASRQIGDRRSKGYYTKTGVGRNQKDTRCSGQLFTGNHSDDARGSIFCPSRFLPHNSLLDPFKFWPTPLNTTPSKLLFGSSPLNSSANCLPNHFLEVSYTAKNRGHCKAEIDLSRMSSNQVWVSSHLG